MEIHFIHVKGSRHENALPLIIVAGGPGSIIELLETVGPAGPTQLPTVAPPRMHSTSSAVLARVWTLRRSRPNSVGTPPHRTRVGGADASTRLHPVRCPGRRRGGPRHGSDGSPGGRRFGRLPREPATAVLAIGDHLPKESGAERVAAEAVPKFRQDGFGYFLEMATRPQTIGYAILDSPVALAAWMLDHDTDSYHKIARAFVDGATAGSLTLKTASSTTSRCTG